MMAERLMENRRRSERWPLVLPVLLKDGRGGERTTTADASLTGVWVFTDQPRPPRQYIELEIELPDSRVTIAVTAIVARCGSLVDPIEGGTRLGMGLDFFLFDVKSKTRWQSFLRNYAFSQAADGPVVRPALVAAGEPEPGPALPAAPEDVPAFLIRPRDLGRLWAFFRGELSRARVRIETGVTKPPGSVVELLVVHPESGAEWILDGEVLSVGQHERGQAVLEIGLPGLDPALTEAFRAFIVSGQGQIQEEVSISAVMSDEASDPEVSLSDSAPPSPESEPVLALAPSEHASEGERIESVVIDFEELETAGFFDDEEPTVSVAGQSHASTGQSHASTGQSQALAGQSHAVAGRNPPLMTPSGDDPLDQRVVREPVVSEPTTDRHNPSPSGSSRPTSVFASFFAEAKEAEYAESTTSPEVLVEPVLPTAVRSAPKPLKPVSGVTSIADVPDEEERDSEPILLEHPKVKVQVDRRRLDSTYGIRIEPAANVRDWPGAGGASWPPPPQVIGPVSRSVSSKNAQENQRAIHLDVSTAGTDPSLDREIAMARARVVRSPDSINASLELSYLLATRGDSRLVDEAIDVVRKVTAMAPHHPAAHHRLAELLARKGDYRLALEHLGEAKRLGYTVDADLERVVTDGAQVG